MDEGAGFFFGFRGANSFRLCRRMALMPIPRMAIGTKAISEGIVFTTSAGLVTSNRVAAINAATVERIPIFFIKKPC